MPASICFTILLEHSPSNPWCCKCVPIVDTWEIGVLLPCFMCITCVTCRFLEPPRGLDEEPLHPYEELEAQLPSSLVEELFGITLLIGRLKDLPANVQSAFTIQHHGKVQYHHCCMYVMCVSVCDCLCVVFACVYTIQLKLG